MTISYYYTDKQIIYNIIFIISVNNYYECYFSLLNVNLLSNLYQHYNVFSEGKLESAIYFHYSRVDKRLFMQ